MFIQNVFSNLPLSPTILNYIARSVCWRSGLVGLPRNLVDPPFPNSFFDFIRVTLKQQKHHPSRIKTLRIPFSHASRTKLLEQN